MSDAALVVPIVTRVFSYCDAPSRGAAIAAPKATALRDAEYGLDTSDDEPNRLKRWAWKAYHSRTRRWIFQTLSYPETNDLAVYISLFMILVVLLSSISFVMETVDDLSTPFNQSVFAGIEVFAIVVFTTDYGLRILCCPNVPKFVREPMNLVDLAAIVPYYVFSALKNAAEGGQSRIVRILSLFRVLRLLKLGSRFQNLQIVIEAFLASLDMLGMLVFLMSLLLVICSIVVYFCETDVNPEMDSIPATFWWCIATLLTVGYGDVVPITPWGKLCAGFTMVSAIIIIALPISVLGANFTQLWTEFKDGKRAELRMSQIMPNFQQLHTLLLHHDGVVAEIAAQVKEQQAGLEARLSSLDVQLEQWRELMDKVMGYDDDDDAIDGRNPSAPPPPPPDPADAERLAAMMAKLKKEVAETRGRWAKLSTTLAVLQSLQTPDLLNKLEDTYTAYKNLDKWCEEGEILLEEVWTLHSDFGDVSSKDAATFISSSLARLSQSSIPRGDLIAEAARVKMVQARDSKH